MKYRGLLLHFLLKSNPIEENRSNIVVGVVSSSGSQTLVFAWGTTGRENVLGPALGDVTFRFGDDGGSRTGT